MGSTLAPVTNRKIITTALASLACANMIKQLLPAHNVVASDLSSFAQTPFCESELFCEVNRQQKVATKAFFCHAGALSRALYYETSHSTVQSTSRTDSTTYVSTQSFIDRSVY
jgi:hypothetical protein